MDRAGIVSNQLAAAIIELEQWLSWNKWSAKTRHCHRHGPPWKTTQKDPKMEAKMAPKKRPRNGLSGETSNAQKRFVFLMFPHKTISGRDPKREPKRSQEWSQKGGRSWNCIENNNCCETMRCEIWRIGDLSGPHCFKSAGVANNWIETIIVVKQINVNSRFTCFQ